ncbi:MAG: hypothetical protein KGL39_60295 [Patescibacteria group bacterium]|nr:hypothetical protein [Patescibacteria group bacterium]
MIEYAVLASATGKAMKAITQLVKNRTETFKAGEKARSGIQKTTERGQRRFLMSDIKRSRFTKSQATEPSYLLVGLLTSFDLL